MNEEQPKNQEATAQNNPLEAQVKELEASLTEAQDKYLRLLAESENARKRMIKEREELIQLAQERLFSELLLPLDHFDKALKFIENVSEEVKSWAIGFEMILAQFKHVLSSHGITEFDSVGKHFDPHFHEAIEVEETLEVEPGIILQEFVKGYKKGDRVIRVAKVKVTVRPKETPEKN